MKDAKAILEEFHDFAEGRCTFDLKNGWHYEGYVFEVKDDHLVFGGGGPLAPEEDLLIPIDAIDLSTLSYFDETQRCYIDAIWSEEQGKWILKPYRRTSD